MLWSGQSLFDFMSSTLAYFAVFAAAMLLLRAKALFLSQTFKKTGVLILMLGRVIQECLPYFFMLIGIMIGFGLTMHVALSGNPCTSGPANEKNMRYRWGSYPGIWTDGYWYPFSHFFYHSHNERFARFYYNPRYRPYSHLDYHAHRPPYSRSHYEHNSDSSSNCHSGFYSFPSYGSFPFCFIYSDDIQEKVKANFGTLYHAIISMAYATVGMFEPEVFFHCGSLSWFVVALFVLYLVIQMIIMFNLLLAAMGDAFDGVRADEEESFLMARASFIDQNEASLTKKEIQALKREIGKYLYVLIPEDKQLEDNVPFWKGRIPTIKEDVRTIIQAPQECMTQNIHEVISDLRDENKNDMKSLEERLVETLEEKITTSLEERFVLLEQRIASQIASIKFRHYIRSYDCEV